MSLVLSGTTGLSDVDGTAAAPALTGTDSNTGIFFPAADTIAFSEGGVEAARFDSSGNLGIGTSSPSTKLHVQGNARSANSGNTVYTELQNDGVYATGTDLYLLAPASKLIAMYAGGSERARIDSSGNLLVGSTSDARHRIYAERTNADWSFGSSQTGSGTFYHMVFRVSGTAVGQITSTTSTTSYTTSSDYRLKEAIAPMTGALAKVALLKPCTYKWKVDGSDGQGFIAHELDEVVQGCVTGEKDAVDADGNPQYQGIDTSFLVATLTAALQEQQALITALTTRITALEAA